MTLEERRARSDKARAYYWANREKCLANARKRRLKAGAVDWKKERLKKIAVAAHPIMEHPIGSLIMKVMHENKRLFERLSGESYDIDHIIPLSAGGDHATWNLQPLSKRENAGKRKALY